MVPNRQSGYNCRHLTINTILNFFEYPCTSSIWKQCGLNYIKKNGDIIGELFSNYLDWTEEISWLSGLNIVQINNDDDLLFISSLKNILIDGYPIILNVDLFFMENSIYYEQKHAFHYITLIEIIDEECLILDDTYNFKGKISINSLLRCVKSEEFNIFNNGYYLVQNHIKILDKKDLSEIIQLNVNHLKGNAQHTGIISVEIFNNELKLIDKNQYSYKLCQDIYTSLSRISSSRFAYSNFLFGFNNLHDDVRELAETYFELSQKWQVGANMILKGTVKNREDYFQRMINKLDEISTMEQQCLSLSESFLDNI
jgi:hypothetical protein